MSESSHTEDPAPDVAATPARQGRFGKPVFWVLVASTLLAAVAMFIAWGFRAPALQRADDKVNATREAHAADFSAPQPRSPTPPIADAPR